MTEWREVSLHELVTISRDAINPQEIRAQLVRHFSLPAFDMGAPILERPEAIKSNTFEVRGNEVLFSKLNRHIPRVWWPRPNADLKNIASTEFLVVSPTSSVDSGFLFQLMRSPHVLKHACATVKGTTGSHQRVDVDRFLRTQVLLPPLEEQRRIAGVLGALDDLIEVNRRLIVDLRNLALARYQEAASGAEGCIALKAVAEVNSIRIKPQKAGRISYLDIASVSDGIVDWPKSMDWSLAPSRARRGASAGSTIWSTVLSVTTL